MRPDRVRGVRLSTVLSLCLLANTGCFGSFALVRKIYDFNQSFRNKFVRTIVFWLFCIVPVYEVCALGDAVIFNLIEFWTGSNVLASAPPTQTEQTKLVAYLADAKTPAEKTTILNDLFWAVLNSKEFIFNH